VKSSNEAPDVSEFMTLNEMRLLFVRLPLDIVFTTLNSSFVNVNVDVADMVYNVVPPPPPPNDVKYVITLQCIATLYKLRSAIRTYDSG
jgi:hypothetical protein